MKTSYDPTAKKRRSPPPTRSLPTPFASCGPALLRGTSSKSRSVNFLTQKRRQKTRYSSACRRGSGSPPGGTAHSGHREHETHPPKIITTWSSLPYPRPTLCNLSPPHTSCVFALSRHEPGAIDVPVDPRESVTTAADTKARSPRPRSRSWALQRRTEAAAARRQAAGSLPPQERTLPAAGRTLPAAGRSRPRRGAERSREAAAPRAWADRLRRQTEAAVQAWPRREPEGGVTPGERNARAGEDVA